jgi:Tfp pilus assembly protein PilV
MEFSVGSNRGRLNQHLPDNSGMTLVETLIAILILMFGLLAMAHVLTFGTVASKTHGRDATKATAYAHDKMEELLGLQFNDTTTNVTVTPPFPSNGVGLTAGGSIPPTAATAGYVDYLDTNGARTTAALALYTRQWQIINDSTTLKRVIVSAVSNKSFKMGTSPTTVLVTYKVP